MSVNPGKARQHVRSGNPDLAADVTLEGSTRRHLVGANTSLTARGCRG
jgi:hypothetical protein